MLIPGLASASFWVRRGRPSGRVIKCKVEDDITAIQGDIQGMHEKLKPEALAQLLRAPAVQAALREAFREA